MVHKSVDDKQSFPWMKYKLSIINNADWFAWSEKNAGSYSDFT